MKLRAALLLTLFLSFVQPLFSLTPPAVPERMEFCGMKLRLSAALRERMQKDVNKLYASEEYFSKISARIDAFFPYVEEALAMTAMPDDLKYVCVLESALIGDAVSPSNAVGFWQFKEATAREVGLTINDSLDDRKHIFHATIAAAKYFWRLYRDYDNWIYALIGYNQGPTGALAHIDAAQFGAREMELDEKLHFYAMKSLAHKIAFEPVAGKNPQPNVWLKPVLYSGTLRLDEIAGKENTDTASFRKFNLWSLKSVVPANGWYAVLIPVRGSPPPPNHREQVRAFFNQSPPAADKPEPVSTQKGKPQKPEKLIVEEPGHDPSYGESYVFLKPGEHLVEIAVRSGKSLKDIRAWNGISAATEPPPGTWLRLENPDVARFHILTPGDSWESIEKTYGIPKAKILKRNHLPEDKLIPGMKLWLRKPRPKKIPAVKILLPDAQGFNQESESPVVHSASQNLSVTPDLPLSWKPIRPLPDFETQWVKHTVAEGEGLWKIAVTYGSSSELLKKINGLSDNKISPGQELKVMVRKPKE